MIDSEGRLNIKAFLAIFVVLTVLAAGCSPSGPINPEEVPVEGSSSPAEVDTTPSPATSEREPEPTSPPANQEEEPGIEFIWTIDPGVRLEDATVPNIHRAEDGRFRLYYGGQGGILSAISDDGLSFSKEPGVRVTPGTQDSLEMIVSDPTLVALGDGRVRLYYKGATGPGGPGQSIHSVFSAISTDGLLFEKEGIRIDSQQTPDRGWASVPEAIVLPDGRVRIYYVSDGLDVRHGIVSAVSDDGLIFTREETRLTGFVDPAVIRLEDGSILMVAVAFPFGSGGKLTDAAPGIYSFTSPDGINFENRKMVLPGEGNIDPAIIGLGDETYRIYYWNIMDQPPVIRSLSGKTVSNSPVASSSAIPDIVPVLTARSIAGARVWLFAIDDGSPELAVSAEADGKLIIGRLDVTDPSAAVSWQTAAGPDDTGGVPIADHWHIFAHGYHWIVFSVAGDSASYLMKLDKDFQRLAIVPVGHTDGPTNDMFLVAEPDGVAVGHFAPGYGHTVHRFDLQANKTGQVRIGGGEFAHANGSSAILVERGYLVFASETLNPSSTGAVRALKFDSSWRPVDVMTVLDENGTNAAMATAVRLDSGYTIVHLRVRTGVSPGQAAPVAPEPGSPLPDDSGALLRLVLSPDGAVVSTETLVTEGSNRVHSTLSGDLLITSWDGNDTVSLRVDRIE